MVLREEERNRTSGRGQDLTRTKVEPLLRVFRVAARPKAHTRRTTASLGRPVQRCPGGEITPACEPRRIAYEWESTSSDKCSPTL